MIPDQYYRITFFISITIIVILGVVPSFRYKKLSSFPDMNLVIGTILLLVIPILFMGLRNPYGSWKYFGDTSNYTRTFLKLQNDPLWKPNKDLGFYVYMKLISNFFSIQSFLFISILIYILPVYFAFLKWFKKYAYFALITFVSSMSFWAYGANGIRNGLATSIFILALAFFERKWLMIFLIMISISFHASMLLPTIALIIVHFYKNTNLLLKIWAISIPISFLIGRKLESSLKLVLTSSVGVFDHRANYGGPPVYFYLEPSKFRLDFIFYSGLVIFLGYYFIYKLNFKDKFYLKIFNLYLIANTIWLYFIYFPFTNRIAYLSWFLIPILAIYPIIYSTKLKNQSYFMAISVLSSLFFAWTAAALK